MCSTHSPIKIERKKLFLALFVISDSCLGIKRVDLGVKNLICVDPAPGDWSRTARSITSRFGKPGMQPEYATVDELVKARPELVGDVVVLLPWCSPSDVTYDIDALIALQPTSIVIVYSPDGSAASSHMQNWLFMMGMDATPNPKNKVLMCKHIRSLPEYEKVYERQRHLPLSSAERTSLLWLSHEKLSSDWQSDAVLRDERPSDKKVIEWDTLGVFAFGTLRVADNDSASNIDEAM
jgi:hypothetical protein